METEPWIGISSICCYVVTFVNLGEALFDGRKKGWAVVFIITIIHPFISCAMRLKTLRKCIGMDGENKWGIQGLIKKKI